MNKLAPNPISISSAAEEKAGNKSIEILDFSSTKMKISTLLNLVCICSVWFLRKPERRENSRFFMLTIPIIFHPKKRLHSAEFTFLFLNFLSNQTDSTPTHFLKLEAKEKFRQREFSILFLFCSCERFCYQQSTTEEHKPKVQTSSFSFLEFFLQLDQGQ